MIGHVIINGQLIVQVFALTIYGDGTLKSTRAEWGTVCLGSLDPSLQAVTLSPSNLTADAGCEQSRAPPSPPGTEYLTAGFVPFPQMRARAAKLESRTNHMEC